MLQDSSTEGRRFLEDQEDLEQLSVSATDNAGNDSCDEAGESSEDVGISLDWKPGIRSESLSDFQDQYRQSYPTSQVDVGQFESRSIVIKEDLDAESPTRIVEVPSEMKNSAERLGSEDRFDLIGKTVALKLRNLPKGQMLIAENLIHQVLFQAELETLSFQHRIVGETRRNQDEYCYQAQNSTE
ncbi:Alcohol dehydrogenase transcription factor Myb/SANT-like [Nesidiocoris tenuis]|uniref:Alcohol dehydrogenase transcription factor Myb/SANT-like n=1 Tax=Nesidiocoris tenuis TaxID=355587 RepID=A0ABN7AN87_9HEMI|nr:Alcohol dehydrogenase transcription factor Myb/SANT-like [Nesidiocoris tenuis]